MSTKPFNPEKKPRLPDAIKNLLEHREGYFNPQIGQDEDGFTLQDAESLGWNVDIFHASKPFPDRGLVEVHAGRDVEDSDEGRYGVLKAIYAYELKAYQRARGSARETYLRLVRVERERLRAGNDLRKAIRYAREALRIEEELDAFTLGELPADYINELREEQHERISDTAVEAQRERRSKAPPEPRQHDPA